MHTHDPEIKIELAKLEHIPYISDIARQTWLATYPIDAVVNGQHIVVTQDDVLERFAPDKVEQRNAALAETLNTSTETITYVAYFLRC